MLVHFQLHNAKGPIGDAIKDVSGGAVTHVSIRCEEVLGEPFLLQPHQKVDHVWEARFGEKIKPIPWNEYKYKKNIIDTITFELSQEEALEALLWLKEQKGKSYDWLGPLSFVWFWIPVRNGLWFCSEFAMVFLMKFIAKMKEYDQKQTPYGFGLIAKLVKQLKVVYPNTPLGT